ncbi:Methyltransferase type 12 [hydrothermal vent metagenome]|uniref:Methyltransferase type 12 n=1 Tax=hydrothermal vent metagenome TaxID=652676 RepID=A0A3B0ZZX5_9ZZZZ
MVEWRLSLILTLRVKTLASIDNKNRVATASGALATKWDDRYRTTGQPGAARVLAENSHLLPASGEALDLACGLGGNALLLAQAGLRTQAWDISPLALERLNAAAAGLPLRTKVCDVLAAPPAPLSFDIIVVSRFLARDLCPALMIALRPGGLLFYQTFTRDKGVPGGPSNPDFLLAKNELLQLFTGLHLRVYREEGCIGDTQQGLRNEALLVAQKTD